MRSAKEKSAWKTVVLAVLTLPRHPGSLRTFDSEGAQTGLKVFDQGLATEFATGEKNSMHAPPDSHLANSKRTLFFLSLAVLIVGSCTAGRQIGLSPGPQENQVALFTAETVIQDEWQRSRSVARPNTVSRRLMAGS